MKIIDRFTPSDSNCEKSSTVTLGTFGGVHTGHLEILGRVTNHARSAGTASVVMTFHRPPASVLGNDTSPNLITTNSEKLALFENAGIEIVCILEFTEAIAAMYAEDFIRDYLVTCLGMKHFVVGYDHGFGHDRGGKAGGLKKYADRYGFEIEVVPPVIRDGREVKSSIIRGMLREGDVVSASLLLGREYSITGTVVHGESLGRKLGFPTANIVPDDPGKIVPGSGVYAGWTSIAGKKHRSVISAGPRPTFDISEESLEVHIPCFEKELYGEVITVGFVRRLRDIVRFESQRDLIEQIQRDIEAVPDHIVS